MRNDCNLCKGGEVMKCHNFLCDNHAPFHSDKTGCGKWKAYDTPIEGKTILMKNCETRKRYNRVMSGKLTEYIANSPIEYVEDKLFSERNKYYGRNK